MLPIVAIIFFISISVAIIAEKHRGYYGEDMGLSYWIKMTWRFETYMAEAVSAILFIWLIILICMKTELKNKVLSFLGSHTLEMYLTHAFFLETFAVSYNWKKGSAFYGKPGLLLLVTFAGTIPASIILKKLTEIVLKGIDKKK